jgi:hypothetical protein
MFSITLRIELGLRDLVVLLHAAALVAAWFFA